MPLIEIDGTKPNSKVYQYNEFEYYESRSQKKIYNCTQRNAQIHCPVILKVDDKGNIIVKDNLHNHPKPERADNNNIKRELKRRSTESLPVCEIVKQVLKGFQGVGMTEMCARQIVTDERKKFKQEIPNNLFELSEMLKGNKLYKKFYIGKAETENGKIAILFGSEIMVQRLQNASHITIDGTSRCLPPTPPSAQLLTFHIHKAKKGIIAIYIICSDRSSELYTSIWKFLIKKCKTLTENLKSITCHYDEELIKSIREVNQLVEIRGSWFNYIKLLSRKWNTLNLPNNYDNEICKISWILKLLDKDKVNEGVELLQEKAKEEAKVNENFILYGRFIQNISKLIKKELFIGDNVDNAVNYSEAHTILTVTELGSEKPLHSFLGLLINNIRKNEKDFSTETHGLKAIVKINTAIVLQQKKMKKKLSIENFANQVLTKKMVDLITVQLSWPQYKNDDGKLNGFPLEKYFFPPDVDEINEDEIEIDPRCVYCLAKKAIMQIKNCKHFTGCYTCWLTDYYVNKSKKCAVCRAPYEKFELHF